MAHLRRCLLSKYLKTHINENPNGGSPLLGFFFRGCSCLKCTNRPEVHQPRRNAPFTLLVQQRLLHPLEGTNRAEMHHLLCWCSRDCCTPWKAPRKNCTNRANHKRLCWGAWVWQGCHTLLQLLALMRFKPVLAPTRVSHERHVQRIGVLHLFDNNLFYTLLLLRQDGEVEFVVHLQNHL